MPMSFTELTSSQIDFVVRVNGGLAANLDPAQLAVYGDGSASPNGEKFAAVRQDCSWLVVFDFGTGKCFEIAVQLPSDWIAEWKKQQMEKAA